MDDIARTPAPPYDAVVFTSLRADTDAADAADDEGCAATSERMVELAREQPGFLGVETARSPGGLGITVSHWRGLGDIEHRRRHAEHRVAQEQGRSRWYRAYRVRVGRVERESVLSAGEDAEA